MSSVDVMVIKLTAMHAEKALRNAKSYLLDIPGYKPTFLFIVSFNLEQGFCLSIKGKHISANFLKTEAYFVILSSSNKRAYDGNCHFLIYSLF